MSEGVYSVEFPLALWMRYLLEAQNPDTSVPRLLELSKHARKDVSNSAKENLKSKDVLTGLLDE